MTRNETAQQQPRPLAGLACACAILLAAGLAACPAARAGAPEAVVIPGVTNGFRVTNNLLSGSEPAGADAFAALARMGVKTIVSVDGAIPDVRAARAHGLRYIHLPVGYDGISEERAAQLAEAATSAPGRIFVHCHHGRHRGPAAVALMCRATAGWCASEAEDWLRLAGTATDYTGLYHAVRAFSPLTGSQPARNAVLPETTAVEALAEVMARLDRRFETLEAHAEAQWEGRAKAAGHPPGLAATLLWEDLREAGRAAAAMGTEDVGLLSMFADSVAAANSLRVALREPAPDNASLANALHAVHRSCSDCHKAYRN